MAFDPMEILKKGNPLTSKPPLMRPVAPKPRSITLIEKIIKKIN